MGPSRAWQVAVGRLASGEAVTDHLASTEAGRALVRRSVPGPEIADAVAAAAEVRLTNRWASLLHLGGPPFGSADVATTIETYAAALAALSTAGLAEGRRADVTVAPLDLGIALPGGPALATEATRRIAEAAADAGTGLTLGPPPRPDTAASLALAAEVARVHPQVRVGLRTDLARSEGDCAALCSAGIGVAVAAGDADTHRRFIRCVRILADAPTTSVFAVHDPRLVAMVTSIVRRRGLDPARFEFAMPYGARAELQRRIADRGHQVRVVIPWGAHWRELVATRLAERHRGLLHLARSLTDRGLGPNP